MRFRSVIALAAAACTACAPGVGTPATTAAAGAVAPARPSTRAALRGAIDSVLDAPVFRNAFWGVLVVDPARGDTLYARNADRLFVPASNEKILTGAVALAQLGADFRWRTTFAARGSVRAGSLLGDLMVVGGGDPSVSDAMRSGDALAPLRDIADSLLARGIRRIAGRIVAGGDAFPPPIYGAGWSWDDLGEGYGAGVDGLLFNEGFTEVIVRGGPAPGTPVVTVTRPLTFYPPVRVAARTVARPSIPLPADTAEPRVTIAHVGDTLVVSGTLFPQETRSEQAAFDDPARAYVAAVNEALARRGLRVDGASSDTLARVDTVFVVESPPLRDVLRAMEKPSQNQLAEVVFRTLALQRISVANADSAQRIVGDQLVAWGAPTDGFVVRDGSGLSRLDRVSPRTIVHVLDAMRRSPQFVTFVDALPVAGVDGTLERRMRGTPAQGTVRAKTGTLDGVSSLSGYVSPPTGRTLIFSILSNNWTAPTAAARAAQDSIASRLAAWAATP